MSCSTFSLVVSAKRVSASEKAEVDSAFLKVTVLNHAGDFELLDTANASEGWNPFDLCIDIYVMVTFAQDLNLDL